MNALSAAIVALSSSVSVHLSAMAAREDSVVDRVSANSGMLGGFGSVTSNELSAANARIDAVSNAISVLSQQNSVAHAALGSRIDSVANRVSANSTTGGGLIEITLALAALSAGAQSAVNTQSARIDAVSQALSSLSQNNSSQHASLSARIDSVVNAVSGLGAVQTRVLNSVAPISATNLTNIPGLSVSVSAGGVYEMRGALMYSFSGASSGNAGLGLTFPAVVNSPMGAGGYITMGNQGQQANASAFRRGYFTGAGSGSNIVSGYTATQSAVPYFAEIDGIFNMSATGAIQLQAKAASAGAGAIHFLPGSYVRLFRIG